MAAHQGTSTREVAAEHWAAFVESERADINTMIPGTIVSYDPKTQTATIQPRLSMTIKGKTIRAPELLEVPVAHPRAGGHILHKTPKKGDEVMLHVAQRSLDKSGADASDTDHAPKRMHHLSDAVAHLSSYSKPARAKNMPEKGTFFGTDDGKAGTTMSEDGRFNHKKDGDDLKSILTEFMKVMKDHTNEGAKHDQAGAVAALISRLDKLMA